MASNSKVAIITGAGSGIGKETAPTDYPILVESIKYAQGRWIAANASSPKEN